MKSSVILTATILALMLGGCRSYDTVSPPNLPYEAQWRADVAEDASPIDSQWWQSFSSTTLNQLIEKALIANPDLLISAERLKQAEFQLNSAGASLYPSASLSASSAEKRNKADADAWLRSESSSASLGINYEVDLWGKVDANLRSARYSYQATAFDQETVRISVTTAIANAYFQWLSLVARVNTAQENLAIAKDIYRIVNIRYQNGVASAADVARQRSSVLSLQSSLVPLQMQARQSLNAIAVLLGESPQGYQLESADLASIHVPEIDPGLPVDVIARRPDLAAAEAQLYAANANVTAARAALLPSVSLSGSAGVSSSSLFSLANSSQSLGWSTSLTQTIFDGGRLRNQVKINESKRVELIESYRKSILVALQEVDSAQDTAMTNQHQEYLQTEMVAEARRTLSLTQVRYREGSDDLLSLLDAQRSLFQAEDSLVQLRAARLNAALNLYKALGGGWLKPDIQ